MPSYHKQNDTSNTTKIHRTTKGDDAKGSESSLEQTIDLNILSQKVYHLLCKELQLEHERLGDRR